MIIICKCTLTQNILLIFDNVKKGVVNLNCKYSLFIECGILQLDFLMLLSLNYIISKDVFELYSKVE